MKITADRNARLPRPDAELGLRQGPHRPGRALRLGRGDARVAHARGRRARSRTSRQLLHRRRPDAHRAPLADDVPPALLARHGHRPGDGDRRHRHRAVGHPGQGARRALPQALGRAGARPRAPLLPPRRGQDGGLLRAGRRRSASPTARRRWSRTASPRSSRWPCRRRCRSKAWSRSATPRLRGGDARGGRRGHRHHGRLPRPALAAHGPALRQGARAVRPLLARRALLAGAAERHGRDPARRDDADRDRRAADEPAGVPRPARRPAAASVCSPTSRTAAG